MGLHATVPSSDTRPHGIPGPPAGSSVTGFMSLGPVGRRQVPTGQARAHLSTAGSPLADGTETPAPCQSVPPGLADTVSAGERQTDRKRGRNRDRERQREREGETETERQREKQRQRERQRETEGETERDRERETEREGETETEREGETERERDRQRETESGKEMETETGECIGLQVPRGAPSPPGLGCRVRGDIFYHQPKCVSCSVISDCLQPHGL